MSPLDAALVRRKLAGLARNLRRLGAVEGLTLAEYIADPFRQKGVEKMLQEIVEAAVDVNLHVLRALGRTAPDYYTSFIEVGKAGVIQFDLAERLAPAAGLRNRLVHDYEDIDDQEVLAAIARARTDFRHYMRQVERYLESAERRAAGPDEPVRE